MPANCGEGSSQISSQIVYSSHEEFLSQNVRKYVEEVFDLSKETVCVVLGTIRSVEQDHGWFYVACSKCNKKVVPNTDVISLDEKDVDLDEDIGVLYCPKCKIRSPKTVPRFKVRVRVQDTSGTISFVMFDKETKHILRRSAYDIRNQQVKDCEENAWPRELNHLIGKRFVFKIEVFSYNLLSNYNVYTVLKVCDDPEIIKVMLEADESTEDIEGPHGENNSAKRFSLKDATSYTEDSEVQTYICKNDATSPGCKRGVASLEIEDNVEASSTNTVLKKIKIEKL